LSLPGLKLETALISQNKWKQKRICEIANIPHARGILWTKDCNVSSLPALPLIVKPIDSAGSRGITVLNSLDQLDDAYNKALKFSPSKAVLIEEFITGKEVSVETFWQEGQMHILAISERILSGVSANRIQTFKPSDDVYKKISKVLAAYHQHIGMTNGVTHSELMITSSGEVYFLESACREGGVWVFEKLVGGVTKTDFRRHYLELLLGKKFILNGPFCNLKHGILYFIPSQDGVFRGIKNIENLNQFKGVEYKLLVSQGARTFADGSDSSRLGVLFIVDSSEDSATSKLNEVLRLLEVEYEND
jgi:biotin carboxylase